MDDLTAFDVACGWPFDDVLPSAAPLRQAAPESVAGALEAVLLPALERAPCVVAFSGGRDSSVVLAAAVRAARRHGLPDPVPASFVFPASAPTVETEWQQRVLAHLGLDEHLRVDRPEELDYLGPVAQRVLRRHGLTFPPNAFLQALVLEHARGGALVTGVGGDELFGSRRRQRAADVLARRVRPRPRDIATLALAVAPPRVRIAAERRRGDVRLPWLRPRAHAAMRDALARRYGAEPFGWARRVAWLVRLRYVDLEQRALAALASDADAAAFHPFFDPRVVAAVGAAGGRLGLGARTAALEALFGDLLPPDVLRRRSKARFAGVWAGARTRAFIAGWDGGGVDRELVDVERLRALWRGPTTDARSALLLHRAWLQSGAPELDECSTPES